MKKRNLIVMVLLLLFTFGIYGVYWYCSFQNQLKKQTGLGFGGIMHLVVTILTFGIYGLYWTFVVGQRLEKLGGVNNGLVYFLLGLFGLEMIAWPLMQNDANQIYNNTVIVEG